MSEGRSAIVSPGRPRPVYGRWQAVRPEVVASQCESALRLFLNWKPGGNCSSRSANRHSTAFSAEQGGLKDDYRRVLGLAYSPVSELLPKI